MAEWLKYLLMIKILSKLVTEDMLIKNFYRKPTANIVLKGEKFEAFPPR